MPRAIIYVPGIRQRPGGVDDWADVAVAWTHQHTPFVADRYEYCSGAITRWIGQAARVRDLAKLIGMYAGRRVSLVCHSNGAELACRVLREFPAVRLHHLHLFAAACSADYEANGLNAACEAQRVGHIYVYGSKCDGALWAGKWSRWLFGWAGLGYGDLGRAGPQNMSKAADLMTSQEWRRYGHSTWFEGSRLSETLFLATR